MRKARVEKEEQLRQEWMAEDGGKSDESKRDVMLRRIERIAELAAQYERDDAELLRSAGLAADGAGARSVDVADPGLLDAFSYFDRAGGAARLSGELPRLRLENLLLCLDGDASLREVRELLGGLPSHVRYRALATVKQDAPPDGDDVGVDAD